MYKFYTDKFSSHNIVKKTLKLNVDIFESNDGCAQVYNQYIEYDEPLADDILQTYFFMFSRYSSRDLEIHKVDGSIEYYIVYIISLKNMEEIMNFIYFKWSEENHNMICGCKEFEDCPNWKEKVWSEK